MSPKPSHKKPSRKPRSPSRKPKAGRPTDCTPEAVATICEALKRGNYLETSATLAGISERSLYAWMKLGKSGAEPYAAFLQAVKHAQAVAEDDLVTELRQRPEGWQATATLLERRFRSRWARGELEHELRQELAKAQIARQKADLRRQQLETEILEAKAEQLKGGHATLNLHLMPDSKEFADYARQTWGFDRSKLIEAREVSSHEGTPPQPEGGTGSKPDIG